MDFEELMVLFHGAVSAVQEEKVAEVDIYRELGDMDDGIRITIRREVQPFVSTIIHPPEE